MCIMGKLIDKCSDEKVKMAVMVARQIWHRRNNLVFSGKFMSPESLVKTAKDQLEAFTLANQHARIQGPRVRREPYIPWTRLPLGVIKVN